MRIKISAILGLSMLVACAPLALAQDASGNQAQATPPAQGQQQGPGPHRMVPPQGQMGQRGPMNRGMMGRGPMWNGGRNWQFHRMHGHMGYGHNAGFRGPMGGGAFMGMRRGMMGPGEMGRGMGQGPGRGMGMGPGMGRGGQMPLGRIVNDPSMREKLGITAAQAAKINQQNADFQKAGIQNRATLQIKHLELNQLMSAEVPDRAAIDRKLQEISAAQLASEEANIHHRLDMKSALTADQQAKLKELMQSRRPGMGPGGPAGPSGGRGGRGGPGRPTPQPNNQPVTPQQGSGSSDGSKA